MTARSYREFLERKAQLGTDDGFTPRELPAFLFDFQAALFDESTREPDEELLENADESPVEIAAPSGDSEGQ